MTTLADLISQRQSLDEQIQNVQKVERDGALAKIRKMMEENNLTVADLSSTPKVSSAKGKAGAGKKVAVKYRDGANNTWSGRGLQPRWLREALKAGKKIEDFAV